MQRRIADKPPEVQLPITPMLDMAFQLMFFFLATFNPSSIKEGQIELALAAHGEGRATQEDQQNPQTVPLEKPAETTNDLTVSLRGYRDSVNRGLVSALSLNTLTGEEELRGTTQERESQLRERLENAAPGENKQSATVRLAADSSVRWDQVTRIMDVCRKAGYQVRFTQPVDLGFADR